MDERSERTEAIPASSREKLAPALIGAICRLQRISAQQDHITEVRKHGEGGGVGGTSASMPTPFSLVKLPVVACVPYPFWAVMLLVAVQYEHVYDETTKGMAYDESDRSLSRSTQFDASERDTYAKGDGHSRLAQEAAHDKKANNDQ